MTDAPPPMPARALMLAGWTTAALFLAWTHVHWRDEVRALSIALSGNTPAAMLGHLRGEGHPALWYGLLRLAHDLVPVREVLPAMGFGAGAGTAALLALRAPLPRRILGAALFGYWSVFEYAAVDRNYGIAALLMLAFAALYRRWRGGVAGGAGLGLVLALLANSNAPAVLLAGGLGLFWLLDARRTGGSRAGLAAGALVSLLGVAACAWTLFPTVNDAAVAPAPTPGELAWAALLPTRGFALLLPPALADLPAARALLAPLLLGSLLALARSPAALAGGAVGLWSYGLFFQLGYGGGYRHQALVLPFLLALCWLAADAPLARARLERAGRGLFTLLLALQLPATVGIVAQAAAGGVMSRAADLAALVRASGLQTSPVLAAPDALVETLPYYLPNPTWLVRERRWGRTVRFSRRVARPDVTLGDVLADARLAAAARRRPALILVRERLDAARPFRPDPAAMLGSVTATPEQVRRFLAATRRIARFAPASTDESYDVYLLTVP